MVEYIGVCVIIYKKEYMFILIILYKFNFFKYGLGGTSTIVLMHMGRHEAREQAFLLIFESNFKDETVEELIENAQTAREVEINSFARRVFNGVNEYKENIDKFIEDNIIGWKKNRISKVAISIMRLAIYEMVYESDIPNSVSINEAVELAKKYSTKDESSFINGVLGSVEKQLGKSNS